MVNKKPSRKVFANFLDILKQNSVRNVNYEKSTPFH